MEFSGCCAEMVAYGEGMKCHNPSGDNQELSFEASDQRFGYGGMEKWPSITSLSEENMALVRDMFTHSPRKSTYQADCESGLLRHTVRTVLMKDLKFHPQKPHYV